MQDNYYGEDISRMLAMLKDYPVHITVICPNIETVKKREKMRGKVGYTSFTVEELYANFMKETPPIGFGWIPRNSPQNNPLKKFCYTLESNRMERMI